MSNPSYTYSSTGGRINSPDPGADPGAQRRPSRRDFLTVTAAGLASASFAPPQLAGLRSTTPAETQDLIGNDGKRRILLRGGVVLSLDPKVGDFEKADVLIDGKLIADVGPTFRATLGG